MTFPLSLFTAPPALVPQLETPDLLLRGFQVEDLPEAAAMHLDPDFYRFLGGKPSSEEDVWRRMLGQLGHWALLGYGAWSIVEKATGRFVGSVGFFDLQRDLTPSLKGTPEAGWTLAPRLHRRGYGTQALQAALAWADAHLPAPRITCMIDPGNTASLRLARKFGFQEFAQAVYHDEPVLLLERLKRE